VDFAGNPSKGFSFALMIVSWLLCWACGAASQRKRGQRGDGQQPVNVAIVASQPVFQTPGVQQQYSMPMMHGYQQPMQLSSQGVMASQQGQPQLMWANNNQPMLLQNNGQIVGWNPYQPPMQIPVHQGQNGPYFVQQGQGQQGQQMNYMYPGQQQQGMMPLQYGNNNSSSTANGNLAVSPNNSNSNASNWNPSAPMAPGGPQLGDDNRPPAYSEAVGPGQQYSYAGSAQVEGQTSSPSAPEGPPAKSL
jgi:hypothetical protein